MFVCTYSLSFSIAVSTFWECGFFFFFARARFINLQYITLILPSTHKRLSGLTTLQTSLPSPNQLPHLPLRHTPALAPSSLSLSKPPLGLRSSYRANAEQNIAIRTDSFLQTDPEDLCQDLEPSSPQRDQRGVDSLKIVETWESLMWTLIRRGADDSLGTGMWV